MKCYMAADSRFWVHGAGALIGDGVVDDSLIFDGIDHLPGSWKGIEFQDSKSVLNEIHYAKIKNAGSSSFGAAKANIYLTGSSLTIKDTEITGSKGYGIYSKSNSDLTIERTVFSDNEAGDTGP